MLPLRMHKTTDEGKDTQRLSILVLKSLFWMQKKHRWGLGTIETCDSGPKVAVLHAKAADEGWDP